MTTLAELRPGDFCVVRTGGLAGWLIRLGTRSSVNHAMLFLGDGMIVEATQPRIATRALGKGEAKRYTWSAVQLTDQQRSAIVAQARTEIGTRYGWLDVICCALAILGVRWNWVLGRIDDPSTVDCSHLVTRAYRRGAAIDLIPGKEGYLETPGDLLDVIEGKQVPQYR